MTLVLNGEVTLNERAGVQSASGADDLSFSTFQSQVDAGLYNHLFTADGGTGLNLPTSGVNGFPQVAWQSDFISLSDPVTDLAFVSDAAGHPYPAGGVDSHLTNDAGEAIYLFPDTTDHVVIGKTLGGEVCFVLALDEQASAGEVTGGDIYMVQFTALHHTDPDHVGALDTVDLTNLVYVATTDTVTTNYSDFSAAPSGQDVWVAIQPTSGTVTDPDILVTGMGSGDTVNVSRTGLGTNSQAIDQNEGLRIDFVNGAPTTLTSSLVHNGANISYTDHAEGTGGGFSPVQTNPAHTTVSATVHAYNATGDDQGSAFLTGATSHQTSTDITAVRIYDAGGTLIFDSATDTGTVNGISVDLSQGDQAVINGLMADYRVDFSTAGAMDRFTVENTSAQSNRAFDIGGVYLTRTETNVDNTEVGSHVLVQDDGPSAALSGTTHSLTVDETDLATDAHANFADAFTVDGGADGLGATSYALDVTAGPSGLVDTATGENVVLAMNGTLVEGRTATSHDLVFTVSVDGTGEVTLNQLRAVVHPTAGSTPSAYDEPTTLSAASLVTLTRTVGDSEGDQAHATLNIGQSLVFEDDGPAVTLSGTTHALTVDESDLATNAQAGFADAFTPAGGADGLAAASGGYALDAVAGPSGLVDTATGQDVVLSMNAGVVEGRTATSSELVFTVSVDGAGQVSLDQLRAVSHPTGGATPAAHDEPLTLTAANLVTLTRTAQDGDGDTAHATLNIGQSLVFEDDGPAVTLSGTTHALTVDESDLATNAQASFADAFTPAGGADGLGATGGGYALGATAGPSGLVDTATGQDVVLSMNAGVVEGRTATSHDLVFTVSVDGAGQVSLDQLRAVVHPTAGSTAADYDEPTTLSAASLVTLTRTVADGDGDTAGATLNIGQSLVFKDDGPAVSLSGATHTLTVDETDLATNAQAGFADAFTPVGGADGLGASGGGYALEATAGPSGLVDTATGQNVVLSMNAGVVEGRTATSHDLVFTVSVDGSGQVSLDQLRAVVHPTAGSTAADYDETQTLSAADLVRLVRTVADGDGDTAGATLNIGQSLVFKDDGPAVTLSGTVPTLTADESLLSTNPSTSFAGAFTPSGGADGLDGAGGGYALAVVAGPSGLVDTATGQAVVLSMNGATAEGRTATSHDLVFTVSVDGAGLVTLDQQRAVVHPVAGSSAAAHDDPVTLSADNLITLTRTVQDGDGDTAQATLNIGQDLIFKDDGPTISTPAGGTVLWASGQSLTQATGAAPGADGGHVAISNYSTPTGLTANLSADGQHLTYSNGSGALFQVDVTGTNYTFSVLQNAPPENLALTFPGLRAGSPTETLDLAGVDAQGNTVTNVTFDGLTFSGLGPIGAALAYTNPGASSTVDDLNPDRLGFGVKGGQASQMNENEGFVVYAGQALTGLHFDIQGVGNLKHVNVEYWMETGGVVVNHGLDQLTLAKGNALFHETIDSATGFDKLYVRFYFDQSDLNSGVRALNFETVVHQDVPPVSLDLQLSATDGDLDTATTSLFHLTADPFYA